MKKSGKRIFSRNAICFIVLISFFYFDLPAQDLSDEPKEKLTISMDVNDNDGVFYNEQLVQSFLEIKNNTQDLLRIYSCLNKRDIKKAIRGFKFKQLEADYYDEDSKNNFYLDIKNRWTSAIMKPASRAETRFLIDIDDIIGDKSDISFVDQYLEDIKVKVLLKYPTKNGWHIITEPFNPALWNGNFGEIKKDALLLLDY